MRNRALLRLGFFAAALCWSAVGRSVGIARVFVSVNGNDLNTCSNVATPCRTFAGGILQVDDGGEVIVLDSGSYGGTTITKGVTINVPAGVVAFAAQPFTINAASKSVTLRGLTLKALTPGSGTGITVSSVAELHIENCVLNGWATGIDFSVASPSRLYVLDSVIKGHTTYGISVMNGSIASVERTRFDGNPGVGLYVAFNGSTASVRDCVFAGNGIGAETEVTFSLSRILLEGCLVSDNTTYGLFAFNTGGPGNSLIDISNCTVSNNAIGANVSGGAIFTRQNNTIRENGTDVSGSLTSYTPN